MHCIYFIRPKLICVLCKQCRWLDRLVLAFNCHGTCVLPPTYQYWRFVFMIIFVSLPCHSLLLTERFLLYHHLEGLDRSLRLIYQHELTRRTPFEHANCYNCYILGHHKENHQARPPFDNKSMPRDNQNGRLVVD